VAVRADGFILLRTRAVHGLLGGMTEVPTTEWDTAFAETSALEVAPISQAAWRRIPGIVTHVFTHFPLELVVYTADVAARTRAPEGMRWVPIGTLADEALPNVMRKAIAHGLG
jgi:A/G-specific adenine glycosylase